MSLIEEMREEAGRLWQSGSIEASKLVTDWADRLECSGALVPVQIPDSEEVQWAHCAPYRATSMGACRIDGKLYFAGSPESIKVSIPDGEISRVYGEDMIDLVHLVPIAEAEL